MLNIGGNGESKRRTCGGFRESCSEPAEAIQFILETGNLARLRSLYDCGSRCLDLDLRGDDRNGINASILTFIKSNIPAQRLKLGHCLQPRWCMTVRWYAQPPSKYAATAIKALEPVRLYGCHRSE